MCSGGSIRSKILAPQFAGGLTRVQPFEGGRYVVTVDDEPSGYVRSFGGAGINLRDAGEPAESLANLSDSLDAAEQVDQYEGVDGMERFYQKQKHDQGEPPEVTIQIREDEGSSSVFSITEEEFAAVAATLRRMREEEEMVHDPAALEEAVAAFDKFKASIHPRGKEVQPQE
jgi:hypothetical protein